MARIAVDQREPWRIRRYLEALGCQIDVRRLGAGDYEVGERALVERKTVRGLHADVIRGSFWPQLGRFRRIARFAYLLVEGEHLYAGALRPAAIRGVLVAVGDLGVQIVRSHDLEDSARWLHRIAERRSKTQWRSRPAYAQIPKGDIGAPAAEAALCAIPGISQITGQALLDHFGTLAAVVAASPAEWKEVRGIGSHRARAMAITFHTASPASGSGQSPEPQGRAT